MTSSSCTQPVAQLVSKKIHSAGVASMTSVAEAERLFTEVDDVISTLPTPEKFEMTLKAIASKLQCGIGGEEVTRTEIRGTVPPLRRVDLGIPFSS